MDWIQYVTPLFQSDTFRSDERLKVYEMWSAGEPLLA